jgi:hypothetical protein
VGVPRETFEILAGGQTTSVLPNQPGVQRPQTDQQRIARMLAAQAGAPGDCWRLYLEPAALLVQFMSRAYEVC